MRTDEFNVILLIAVISWVSAQIIKTILHLIKTKKFCAERLTGAGGMPSAHSATVCSLVISTCRVCGICSAEFALAMVLAMVVMYDATGVRRAAGLHAKDGFYPVNGRELGAETRIGDGKVDFPALFRKLRELGYDAYVTIEREIDGEQQTEDIRYAKKYLENIINEVYGG